MPYGRKGRGLEGGSVGGGPADAGQACAPRTLRLALLVCPQSPPARTRTRCGPARAASLAACLPCASAPPLRSRLRCAPAAPSRSPCADTWPPPPSAQSPRGPEPQRGRPNAQSQVAQVALDRQTGVSP
uniref:Uncharacterized protein n=1 Tax=Mustela putorius furo TaxID=9669 RepID=M3YTT3_MUSPF